MCVQCWEAQGKHRLPGICLEEWAEDEKKVSESGETMHKYTGTACMEYMEWFLVAEEENGAYTV